MAGEIEATGDLVTGGLMARTVDRRGSAGPAGHDDHGGACLNCGATLAGEFCHVCGQRAHIHRSLSAIWHDLAHGVLHFEGKVWHTLPMLAVRPGELTRRFIAGERARFVSPLALFLFIVFVMFAMLSVAGIHLEAPDLNGKQRAEVQRGIGDAVAQGGERLAALTEERTAIVRRGGDVAEIDRRIAVEQKALSAMRQAGAVAANGPIAGKSDFKTGWKRLDKGIAKAAENPNLLLYKLQTNAYKFAWALVPLSLPFMWLLFPFSRRFRMYDHAVFVTYSLCFVLLLGMLASVLGAIGIPSGWLWLAVMIVIPFHMYRQLRGAYGCSRGGALVRTVLLLFAANLAVALFLLLLIGLGVLG